MAKSKKGKKTDASKSKSVPASEHDARKKRVVGAKVEQASDVVTEVDPVGAAPVAGDEPSAAGGGDAEQNASAGEQRVTFAIRIPKASSEAIHRTAGKGGASRAAAAVLAAFAAEDIDAFRSALELARAHREKQAARQQKHAAAQ